VSEVVDGICEDMTYFAMSKGWPRTFVKADGHDRMKRGEHEIEINEAMPGTNSNPVKVVAAENMHDRAADNKIKKYCLRHMDIFEEKLIAELRYASPEETLVEKMCYEYVPECAQRDEQGADLVAKTLTKPLGFRKLLQGPGWTKIVFFIGSGEKAQALKKLAIKAGNINKICQFGVIEDPELTEKLGYTAPSVVMHRYDDVNITFPLQKPDDAPTDLTDIAGFLRWVQMQSFPPIGIWTNLIGRFTDDMGALQFPRAVLLFDDFEREGHRALVKTLQEALDEHAAEVAEFPAQRVIVPVLVNQGRKTMKTWEKDQAEIYEVKRKEIPLIRGFHREMGKQTFGSRFGGFPPGTELTKENLVQYFRAFMNKELPAFQALSEDLPAEDEKWVGEEAGIEAGLVRKVVGRNFNEVVFEEKLTFLTTFGYPCPDCQYAQPPIIAAARRYKHHIDAGELSFAMMNTVKNQVNGVPDAMKTTLWAFGPDRASQPKVKAAQPTLWRSLAFAVWALQGVQR
jgi:hypothetical protein